MNTDIWNLIKKCEGPKFLAHYICPWDSKERHDLKIYDTFARGEKVKYEPTQGIEIFGKNCFSSAGEFAFSIWPWELKGDGVSWGKDDGGRRQGLIIFSPKFYDKICSWEIPDEELLSLYNALSLPEDTYYNEKKRKEALISLDKKVGLDKIRSVGGQYYGDFIDERDKELYFSWRSYWAIMSILGLRHGPSPDSKYSRHWSKDKISRILMREAPEFCVDRIFSTDYGARAVKFTSEKDIIPLEISRDDVKYFISWGNDEKTPNVLIEP